MASFEWIDAKRVEDALSQMGEGSLVKAGGIDVIDRLKEGLDAPQRLVNIRNVQGLDKVVEEGGWLRIGPLVTMAQLDVHPMVRARYTALADAAGHAATPQIRNMATLGGNLLQRPRCWYFRSEQFQCLKKGGARCFAQEGENEYHAIFGNKVCAIVHPSAAAAALIALGASVEVTGKRGKREIPLDRFFVRPEEDIRRENVLNADELVTEIRVPAPQSGARSAYMKLGEKESFDWPIAEVAVMMQQSAGKVVKVVIVLGAAAPVPMRATAAEQMLMNGSLNEETARKAARAALVNATPLSGNGYKLPIFEAVIRRTILAAGGANAAQRGA